MHVTHLTLASFRSYDAVDLALEPGVTAFVGPNGQGKTNLVEAVEYAATQGSHRVTSDQPLVRFGDEQAIVRLRVRRHEREAQIELEINPGRSNRARINRGRPTRARDALGIVRTVVFSPDNLRLVQGDPSDRRRFLDELLTTRQPRYAGVRADYDKVLRQRNSLLKTAGGRHTGRRNEGALATLDAWDTHLATTGAELLAARLDLVDDLAPHVATAYTQVSESVPKPDDGNRARLTYKPSLELERDSEQVRDRAGLADLLLDEVQQRRGDELDRGVTLVGPHRDDLVLSLGRLPAKGYASHGESWSFALALKLAAFQLLRDDGDDPVLVLDDVFAELDDLRRTRLAALVDGAEQVLVTAAVDADVPTDIVDHRFRVRDGQVTPDV